MSEKQKTQEAMDNANFIVDSVGGLLSRFGIRYQDESRMRMYVFNELIAGVSPRTMFDRLKKDAEESIDEKQNRKNNDDTITISSGFVKGVALFFLGGWLL
jgi:hypothetical protein